jgi:hypothetical protein
LTVVSVVLTAFIVRAIMEAVKNLRKTTRFHGAASHRILSVMAMSGRIIVK